MPPKPPNDNLFGSCRSVDGISLGIKYELMTSEYKRLGEELVQLKTDRYSWHDAFTQCILQNTLIAFAKRESINIKDYCDYALARLDETKSRWSEGERKEIATVLERLLEASEMQQEPVFSEDDETWDDLRSNKRDEIVEVHKYFDKSKGLKRNVYPTFDDSNYLNDDPTYFEEEPRRIDETAFGSPGQVKAYLRVLDQLSDSAKQSGLFDPDFPANDDFKDEERGIEGSMTSDSEPNFGKYFICILKDSLNEAKVADENDIATSLETEALKKGGEDDANREDGGYLTVAPPDEKALEDLMAGNMDPHDLDLDQLKRLMRIVEVMVRDLDNQESEETLSSESEMMEPIQIPDNALIEDDITNDDVIIPSKLVSAGEKLSLDKKAIVKETKKEKDPEDENKTVKPEDLVDMRYTYIQLNRNIDEVEGGAFLEGFASIINLPTSAINDVMTFGDKITFEVLPNPKYNASTVANQAGVFLYVVFLLCMLSIYDECGSRQDNDDVIEKLKSLTGLTIVKAGIGKENQVEVKKNDNKYVVLTFILVGCIAGILLAVVVIYLIKRQSRSKEKLAELADNVEGNEASKDYQDLCRQRMQSKTSDKPEPLHAAGRIGSVSDNVRSPSSRSSTSSCLVWLLQEKGARKTRSIERLLANLGAKVYFEAP
ncbi:hypothetical protein LOTGIDRAFT_238576 [Lottia gigantea]|uniref:Uncharacterized protein n=1 Tax=Lottia gigantea TaxID=225164 RepID=V4A8W3_LOTGI|nr:hypothetical protein LOTGIDRAFT_238576 [Lottia gigantea]ESP00374.1 hypothetical protein LOTGIDRAFT_238576 [Lottia gigantea]